MALITCLFRRGRPATRLAAPAYAQVEDQPGWVRLLESAEGKFRRVIQRGDFDVAGHDELRRPRGLAVDPGLPVRRADEPAVTATTHCGIHAAATALTTRHCRDQAERRDREIPHPHE